MTARKLPRVVLVGFNKCATRSFARLFEAAGHPSLHHKLRRPLRRSRTVARIMRDNLASGRRVFQGIEDFTFYSDLVFVTDKVAYEGNSAYREILRDYPDTILILNLRDREDWIRSRMKHGHGEFADRYGKALGLRSFEEVQDHWRQMWDEHVAGVRAFMADKPGQLIEFDIDHDRIEDLIAKLPQYGLRAGDWGVTGQSRGRKLSPRMARAKRAWAHFRARPRR